VSGFSTVQQVQPDGQAAGGVHQQADRLHQHLHQHLSLQAIRWPWPAQLLQVQDQKSQADHASSNLAAAGKGLERLTASAAQRRGVSRTPIPQRFGDGEAQMNGCGGG